MRRLRKSASAVHIATLFVFLTVSSESDSHPLTFTDTTLTIQANGTFQVDLRYDLDALALGSPISTDDAVLVAALEALSPDEFDDRLENLRRLFKRRVRVRFDGNPTPFEVAFPDHGTLRATEADIPTVLGLTARLTGTVPVGATTVEFFASRAFADVHLTIVDPMRSIEIRSVLERGARSEPYDLTKPPVHKNLAVTAAQYLRLGVVHIVPEGLDHILFVLGLFLLSSRVRSLVWQVTAFTVAHACTLTAATVGAVEVSANIVEPLIAVSVAYIAIENIFVDHLTLWRPVIVFGFGLLHGLGFASALGALELAEHERILALLSFNAGIEIGQLAVIATAVVCIGRFRGFSWYRARIVIPVSAMIAIMGSVWAVERMLDL